MRQCVVVDIPESTLSDIRHHTPSRLPDGRLKRNKIKKPPLAVKKSPAIRRNKNSCLRRPNPFHSIILVRVTPTAKRNSYRVAILVGALTQGSVLRPQPWAWESQLRQSCCCLRTSLPWTSRKPNVLHPQPWVQQ